MTGHLIAGRRRDKSPLERAAADEDVWAASHHAEEPALTAEARLSYHRRDVESATREAARRRALLAFGVPLARLLRPYAPAAGCVVLLWLLRLTLAAPWDLSPVSAALLTVGVATVAAAAVLLGFVTFLSATAETVALLTTRKRRAAEAVESLNSARIRRDNAALKVADVRRSGRQ